MSIPIDQMRKWWKELAYMPKMLLWSCRILVVAAELLAKAEMQGEVTMEVEEQAQEVLNASNVEALIMLARAQMPNGDRRIVASC